MHTKLLKKGSSKPIHMRSSFEELVARNPIVKTDLNSNTWIKKLWLFKFFKTSINVCDLLFRSFPRGTRDSFLCWQVRSQLRTNADALTRRIHISIMDPTSRRTCLRSHKRALSCDLVPLLVQLISFFFFQKAIFFKPSVRMVIRFHGLISYNELFKTRFHMNLTNFF